MTIFAPVLKILAYILSLYILLLTAIPCVDGHIDSNGCSTEQTQDMAGNHQHEMDHCSPFCTCNCCVSPVVFQENTVHFECFPILQEYSTPYSSSYISSLFITIWQPPKLS